MSAHSNIEINSVEPLKQGQSKYVNPIRIRFKENEKQRTWDMLKVHDSVSIVLYNEDRDKLIFVRQFRPAVYIASRLKDQQSTSQLHDSLVSGYTLEWCAGIIDKEGKSPVQIAQEEILEETGYQVDVQNIHFVSSYRSGVGVNGSLQYTYYCSVKDSHRVSTGGGVQDEQIQVIELSPEEARKKLHVADDECTESRPAAMLYGLAWFLYEKLPALRAVA